LTRLLTLLLMLIACVMLVLMYGGKGFAADACALPRAHQTFAGQVVSVHDGDTMRVQRPGCGSIRVRLGNWDAPELNQPGGRLQRDALTVLAKYRRATCTVVRGRSGYASHGRPISKCRVRGRDVGESMARMGFQQGGN
jgi:endonuclease YncB( thermonuclease family)